jgi:hypothetical protein
MIRFLHAIAPPHCCATSRNKMPNRRSGVDRLRRRKFFARMIYRRLLRTATGRYERKSETAAIHSPTVTCRRVICDWYFKTLPMAVWISSFFSSTQIDKDIPSIVSYGASYPNHPPCIPTFQAPVQYPAITGPLQRKKLITRPSFFTQTPLI